MDKSTGEIIPATQAISLFYKTHNYKDAWTDQYIETDLETESELPIPDFTKIF